MKLLLLFLVIPMIANAQIYGGSTGQNAAANFALGFSQEIQRRYAPRPYYYDDRFDFRYQAEQRQQLDLQRAQERYLDEARRQLQAEEFQKTLRLLNENKRELNLED